ncbi:MAG TPA: GNAT family N-acetyltransferase [Vicinamibacterales bacterium]|jgi:L-amino acid N-acyltransferase YncA
MDLSIRDVTPADAEAIVAILNPIIEARVYTVFDRPFSVDEERDYIARLPPRGIWKVAVRDLDRRLVGFQVMEPYGPYTRAFDHVGTLGTYVDLDLRRHGIASRLFAATFEAAVRNGYEKAFTLVRADNGAALETYLRHGFEIVGTARRHTRIDGRFVDEILIEKQLTSPPAA